MVRLHLLVRFPKYKAFPLRAVLPASGLMKWYRFTDKKVWEGHSWNAFLWGLTHVSKKCLKALRGRKGADSGYRVANSSFP